MFQDCPKVNIQIPTHQLAWILDDCFSGQEIITLADQCGIQCESEQSRSLPKKLADDFFDKAIIEKMVSWYLLQKAQHAARRVEYMNDEEIRFFLRDTAQLLEDGEFGAMIWALLINPRDAVQQHGLNLLAQHDQLLQSQGASSKTTEDTDSRGFSAESDEDGSDVDVESAHPSHDVGDEAANTPLLVSPDLKPDLNQFAEQNEKMDQLHQTIHELQLEQATVQHENSELKQQLQELAEEIRRIKDHEQHQYKEVESRCQRLEHENKTLREDVENLSNQLSELHQLKAERTQLALELKSVEKAAYRSLEIIERSQSDFRTQSVDLPESHKTSRVVTTRAEERVSTKIIDRQVNSGGNRNRIMASQPAVGVFVDVQNMFYAAKDRYAGRVDYIKLLDLIVGPRQLVLAYAYVVQIPEINQAGFLSLLEHNGYTIKSKDLRLRGDGSAKGDWDVGITIDVVSRLDALDVVILASGDGDFCALAETIKQQQKRIEVVAFEHNTSMDLLRAADQFFPIGDDLLI
jgi:uncharacterized LabA/DUF88 family protein